MENVSTPLLKNVSLHIRPGEILGIAGVDGNGQSHIVQTLLHIRPYKGAIAIDGKPAPHSTRGRLEKIAFIAEDRHREALILPLSIEDNLMLKDYRRRPFSTRGWLHFRAWRTHARSLIQQFDIRTPAATATAGKLSGGNQQKIVLARELHAFDNAAEPHKSIILAVNPTRGLDIAATAFTFQKLLAAREKGAAVLLIHSDLDELLTVADRVAVLYEGRLRFTAWPDATKEQIGQMMVDGTQVGKESA